MHVIGVLAILYCLPAWLVVVQAILGLICFELAYRKYYRVFAVCEERDSAFQAYRRTDMKYWSRLYFWPGAALLFMTRAITFFTCLATLSVSDSLLYLGQSKDKPLSGWRRWMFRQLHFKILWLAMSCFGGARLVETHEKPIDYSEYLGPDYQAKMPEGKKAPTIVYNHTGLLDWGWFLLSKFQAPTVMETHWTVAKLGQSMIAANQCIVI